MRHRARRWRAQLAAKQVLLTAMLLAAASAPSAVHADAQQLPRVVVQLGRRACNHATGKTVAGALEQAKAEAAALVSERRGCAHLACLHLLTLSCCVHA